MTLAEHGEAHAIIAVTRGGKTARRLSALRPRRADPRDDRSRRDGPPARALLGRVSGGQHASSARSIRSGTLIGRQLVERGLVPEGALVVLVSISLDLGRMDANYLKIQRL